VQLVGEHGSAVVFVKTRFGVEDVTAALLNAGVRAGSLHGARSQAARQKTLDQFKRGRIEALVATDVAARGIHVDDVDLVVHYDMPDNEKDYQHRSGRTGRAGRDGTVVAFVPPRRQRIAREMAESLTHDVTWDGGREETRRDRDARPRAPRVDHGRRDRSTTSDDRGSRTNRFESGARNDRREHDGSPERSAATSRGRFDHAARGDRDRQADRSAATSRGRFDHAARGDRDRQADRSAATSRDRRIRTDGATRGERDGQSDRGERRVWARTSDRSGRSAGFERTDRGPRRAGTSQPARPTGPARRGRS
jgi:superfamily II DNA/RNA helicase